MTDVRHLTLLCCALLLVGCRTPDHWYRRGHHTKQPKLKVRYFTRAIELRPDYREALRERGEAYLAMGQARPAIGDFDRVVKLDPKDATTFSNRAMAYLSLGQPEKARADLERASARAPQTPEVQFKMARLQEEQRKLAAALAGYDKVLARKPGHAAARRFRARLLFRQGKLEAARRDYRQAILLGEPFLRAESYVELVMLRLAEGKPDLAEQVLAEAMRALPGLPVLDYQAGALSYLAGKYRKAYRHFGIALTRRYDRRYCYLFAALTTERVHKVPRARPLRKILASEKLSGWPRPLLEAYAGERTPEQAWQAAANPAQRSEAGYFLGELALLEKKREEARKWFEKAAAQDNYRTLEKYLARLRLAE